MKEKKIIDRGTCKFIQLQKHVKIRYKTILESTNVAVVSILEATLLVQGLPETAIQPSSWCESQTDLRGVEVRGHLQTHKRNSYSMRPTWVRDPTDLLSLGTATWTDSTLYSICQNFAYACQSFMFVPSQFISVSKLDLFLIPCNFCDFMTPYLLAVEIKNY